MTCEPNSCEAFGRENSPDIIAIQHQFLQQNFDTLANKDHGQARCNAIVEGGPELGWSAARERLGVGDGGLLDADLLAVPVPLNLNLAGGLPLLGLLVAAAGSAELVRLERVSVRQGEKAW